MVIYFSMRLNCAGQIEIYALAGLLGFILIFTDAFFMFRLHYASKKRFHSNAHHHRYRWIRRAAEHPFEASEKAAHAWRTGGGERARSATRQRSIRDLIAGDSNGLSESISQGVLGAWEIHSR